MFKLNPELFKDAKSDYDIVGELGYVAFFKYLVFEVVSVKSDEVRGDFSICKITNAESLKQILGLSEVKYEGTCAILTKDLIPA